MKWKRLGLCRLVQADTNTIFKYNYKYKARSNVIKALIGLGVEESARQFPSRMLGFSLVDRRMCEARFPLCCAPRLSSRQGSSCWGKGRRAISVRVAPCAVVIAIIGIVGSATLCSCCTVEFIQIVPKGCCAPSLFRL